MATRKLHSRTYCFSAHLTWDGQENKMFCCCCPTFRRSGIRRVQMESFSFRCRCQLSPLLWRFWLCVRRPQQVTQAKWGSPLKSRPHCDLNWAGSHHFTLHCRCLCVCLWVFCVSLCVCVFMCRGHSGEEHTFPGQKPATRWWKLGTSWCSEHRT